MNLSLKERYKPLGKLGFAFLIIYYLILAFTIISNACFIYDSVRYEMFDESEIIALVLFIFNACTLWKLNKLSFWFTIISVIGLINKYGSIAFEDFFLNSLAVQSEGYVEYKSNSFEIFSGISTVFLLIFLVFIIIKRGAFGFKVISINNVDDWTE